MGVVTAILDRAGQDSSYPGPLPELASFHHIIDSSSSEHTGQRYTAEPFKPLPGVRYLLDKANLPFRAPLTSPDLSGAGSYTSQSPIDHPYHSSGDASSSSYFPSPSSKPRTTHDVKLEGTQSPAFYDTHRYPERLLMKQELPLRSPIAAQFARRAPSSSDQSDSRADRTGSVSQPPTQPATPASTVFEGHSAPVKETLGPKIWTGTHFLPRFVRSAEVNGDLCYFYDDGTHCKSVIDGEPVNAHWGVTKAGKPRKRLAIACVTCREKKIKCDPDYPRCLQCEKFGRVCKFKNAPRGGQNTSPPSPTAEMDMSRRDSVASVPRTTNEESPEASFKRLKVGSDTYSQAGDHPPSAMNHAKSPLPSQRSLPDASRISDDVLERAWKTDPYVSNPKSVNSVITQYFVHSSSATILRFLPEEGYSSWVATSANRKRPEDLMLLYSILAFAVEVSGGPASIASEYAQVAFHAQKMLVVNCIQLVQSRILLAAYYTSLGRLDDSSDLLSAASKSATVLQLYVEMEKSDDARLSVFPMNMTYAGYCECRRRTMWSLFMLERLGGMFPNRPTAIKAEDLHIRLPSENRAFDKQLEQPMPFFNSMEAASSRAHDCTEASLVDSVHIWAECQATIYRVADQLALSTEDESRLHALTQRAFTWYSSLPSRLSFSASNLESAMYSGNVASVLAVNVLYHHAMIKINRHHHAASTMAPQTQNNFVGRCRDHAWSIVAMVRTFEHLRRGRQVACAVVPHVISGAVVEAVDVLTAGGPMDKIDDMLGNVITMRSVVMSMTKVWEGAREDNAAITHRMEQLECIRADDHRSAGSIGGCRVIRHGRDDVPRWQVTEPIDTMLPRDMDVVYI